MASVIIPVLLCLFLGPGVGQLYNREFKKGALLIVVSTLILIVAGVWYYKAVQSYIPSDLASVDPQALQALLTNAATQMSSKEGTIISIFKAVLMALWLYGVVDAYLVADKKRRA